MRYRVAWGRRRAGPGLPAPPLSVPDIYTPLHLQSSTDPTAVDTTSPPAVVAAETSNHAQTRKADEGPYQVEVYSSKEESLEAVRRRMALREPLGPAFVTQAFAQLQQSNS